MIRKATVFLVSLTWLNTSAAQGQLWSLQTCPAVDVSALPQALRGFLELICLTSRAGEAGEAGTTPEPLCAAADATNMDVPEGISCAVPGETTVPLHRFYHERHMDYYYTHLDAEPGCQKLWMNLAQVGLLRKPGGYRYDATLGCVVPRDTAVNCFDNDKIINVTRAYSSEAKSHALVRLMKVNALVRAGYSHHQSYEFRLLPSAQRKACGERSAGKTRTLAAHHLQLFPQQSNVIDYVTTNETEAAELIAKGWREGGRLGFIWQHSQA